MLCHPICNWLYMAFHCHSYIAFHCHSSFIIRLSLSFVHRAPAHASKLHCVAVYYSVLQCITVCCSVLQCVADVFKKGAGFLTNRLQDLHRPPAHARVLLYVAVCCSLLQFVAVCCSLLQTYFRKLNNRGRASLKTRIHDWHRHSPSRTFQSHITLRRCNMLQHTTTHCNKTYVAICPHALANATPHYNALHHSATHYNTLQWDWHCHLPTRTCRCHLNLQHTAIDCNRLQLTATHCNETCVAHAYLPKACHSAPLQQTATDCSRLQQTAADCNRLQQTATDCNRLQ